MRKMLVICLTLILASCSVDDDLPNYSFEVLPVESVEIPETFILGETYPITVSYNQPSSCHAFSEFYYAKNENERVVAPVNYVLEDDNCETLEDELVENTFNFIVTNSSDSYIFKFWQGEDADGEDQYLIIEVPVVEQE